MIKLTAEVRQEQGSNAAGRLRRAGTIPGVLKRSNGENVLIKTDAHAYMMNIRKQDIAAKGAFEIELDGATIVATLVEAQYHIIRGDATHLDFLEVK